MKGFAILVLTGALALGAPFTVLAETSAKSASAGFVVSNPNHTQALGGSSTNASQGLSVASGHSPVVHDPPAGSVPVVIPTP
ncbi:MAG: hypothetical protein ABSG17_21475 [Spirochaetia bacterium]|jgi:hypothetical protein